MKNIPNSINPAPEEPLISSYLHNKAKEKGIPASGTFEITSRCNFNCRMCYVHNSQSNLLKKEELPAEWWIETGKKAVEAGMVFLLITGGEPLLREDFPEIYKALHQMGLVISINTNGYLISDKIKELFNEYPPNRLNISLYGSDNETYKKFTGTAAFDTIMENIKYLRDADIDVRFNCSITPDNRDDMENIFKTANELGIHIKSSSYMYPQVRLDSSYGENSNRLTPTEAAESRVNWSMLRYSAEEFIARAKGMKNRIDEYSAEEKKCTEGNGVLCRAGKSSFWLNKKGELAACGMLDKSFDVKTLGFEEAWNQVKSFTAEIRLPAECTVCNYRHLCNVCAAVCYTETGDFSKRPDYVCAFTRETARLTQLYAEKMIQNKN